MVRIMSACALSLIISACSYSTNSSKQDISGNWTKSGSIVIARPSSAILPLNESLTPRMLSFLPSSSLSKGNWLLIDTKKKSLSIMEGLSLVAQTITDSISAIKPGIYSIAHKQRNPLWYAPSRYFTARQMPTPPEGDAERFRRGALGDFAVFLDRDTPLHSGPVSTAEIGGLKLPENDMAKIYYSLPVGAPVEVR